MSVSAPAHLHARDGSVTLAPPGGFQLKHGGMLPAVRIAFTLYGRSPNEAPVILVCHALTGSSRVADWWADIIGPGNLLDTERYCIAGVNALGSCYGSTGPASAAPDGSPWGERFPVVTVEDMVRAQHDAFALVGIRKIAMAIGGSLGGMQALQWGAAYPSAIDSIAAIGATGKLSPMAIGLNSIARSAIRANPTEGLRIARMIGMLSYKSAQLLWVRHARRPNRGGEEPAASLWHRFDIEGYLQHQGDKLAARMDPLSYLYLTKAMDLFELDSAGWHVPVLLVGIKSDWLYPPEEVRDTANLLAPHARYVEFETDHGHDGFLADSAQLKDIVAPFLARQA
jgi:homoserine O-acetyltransferase/O-succinyltransferase